MAAYGDETSPREKGRPRGKPFAQGNEFRYRPGTSGNPGGRSRGSANLVNLAYSEILQGQIPAELAEKFHVTPDATFAQALALNTILAALKGDVAAAREVRKAAEGWRPDFNNEPLDYEAGREIVDLMLARLLKPDSTSEKKEPDSNSEEKDKDKS
jgi:hypothetical protein